MKKQQKEFTLLIQFPNDKLKKEFMSVNKDLEVVSTCEVVGLPLASKVLFRKRKDKE